MLGVTAASSAPLKIPDSIVLANLVTSGGESLDTSGFFKIKSRLNLLLRCVSQNVIVVT